MSITTSSNNDRFDRFGRVPSQYQRLEGQRDDMLRAWQYANPNWNLLKVDKPYWRASFNKGGMVGGEYYIDENGRWSVKKPDRSIAIRGGKGQLWLTDDMVDKMKSVTTEPTTNKGKTEMEYAEDDRALHVDNVEIDHYRSTYTAVTLQVHVPTKDLKTIHRVVADVVELIEELDVK